MKNQGAAREGRMLHQLGILVLTGSQSMSRQGEGNVSLAENVNRAVRDFLAFFKSSSVVENYSIGVITYDTNAFIHTPVTELKNMDDNRDYDPQKGHGGSIFIGRGLEEAEKMALEFLDNPQSTSIPHDVRILLLSDNCCQHYDQTIAIAKRIKKNTRINIYSSLFINSNDSGKTGFDEAKKMLIEIAGNPIRFKATYKEKELRNFFISSLSVMA